MSFTAETPIAEIASLDKKLLKNLTKIGYTKVNDLLTQKGMKTVNDSMNFLMSLLSLQYALRVK